jgi:hypothetical protein
MLRLIYVMLCSATVNNRSPSGHPIPGAAFLSVWLESLNPSGWS